MARPRRADQIAALPVPTADGAMVDPRAVDRARSALPDRVVLHDLANLFAALGDPTRLRMVAALAHQELCVHDLASAIGQTTSAVSHHLRQLRTLGLVRGRRSGRRVYYSLDDRHVGRLYGEALDHVRHRTEGLR